MTDSGTEHDSITVLLCSDDAYVRAAESHLTGTWDGAEVLGATTHGDALALLGDREVDCVVYDDAIGDDGATFASRVRADYPDLPFVLRTDRASVADDPALVAEGHTDVLWRREGSEELDELAARIAAVVAAARNGAAGGQERRVSDAEYGRERQPPDPADKIEALHEAATDIVTCRTEEEVYERTIAAAEQVLEFDVCCTMIYDDGMLVPKAMSSDAPPDGARPMRPDEGKAGQVFQTGEPHLSDDSLADEVAEPTKDFYRSGMSVPIGDVGVFQAVSTELGDFSEVDLELAELLLSHTEAALDRIEFDEALQEEHERYRSLFELTTDCISESTLVEDRAIVRQVNPAFEEVFGYDADEIVGEELDDFVTPPLKLAEGLELNHRSVEGGRFEREVTRETVDGPHEFLLRSVPFEIGGEQRCFAVYTDITERRQLERRTKALIEHSNDVVTVVEADGTITYQSPSLERVLGYDPEATVGENLVDLVHPDDRASLEQAFADAIEDPELTPTEEYRIQHADGTWRTFESIGKNHLDDPAVEGFVVNSRDVTERKERLRILEELPVAARELRAVDTEDEVTEITVDTARNVLGLTITGIWLYDDDESVLRPAAYTRESEELFDDHPLLTPEGESLCWEAFESGAFRIYDDVSEEARVYNPDTAVRSEMIFPLGQYGVINIGSTERETFTDVDVYFARILAATAESALERLDHEESLRRQQRELRRQNERLDEFASVVSHDLRNPLTVAQGYAELIEDADSAEEAAGWAAEIAAALGRMETLVEDVLALARQGRTIGDPELVDLRAVTETAWENVETGDADLVVAEDVTFLADESRLVQLLENLVRNAMEHGNADRLQVGPIRADDGVAGFSVDDDGSGISSDRREQVFDLGFTSENEGAGLGLAIVEQIAEAHGWTVSVSESEEGGARFEFGGVETE